MKEVQNWKPASTFLGELISKYSELRDGDRQRAEKDAVSFMVRRLLAGKLLARSKDWRVIVKFEFNHKVDGPNEHLENSVKDGQIIRPLFWAMIDVFVNGKKENNSFHRPCVDWVAGDFMINYSQKYDHIELSSSDVFVEGFSVEFLDPLILGLEKNLYLLGNSTALKKKPISNAMLLMWWDNLTDYQRSEPINNLWHRCLENFPDNQIARQRIRLLDPGRKPGPKPISGKTIA